MKLNKEQQQIKDLIEKLRAQGSYGHAHSLELSSFSSPCASCEFRNKCPMGCKFGAYCPKTKNNEPMSAKDYDLNYTFSNYSPAFTWKHCMN